MTCYLGFILQQRRFSLQDRPRQCVLAYHPPRKSEIQEHGPSVLDTSFRSQHGSTDFQVGYTLICLLRCQWTSVLSIVWYITGPKYVHLTTDAGLLPPVIESPEYDRSSDRYSIQ